jgi:Ser/Thr protein kinase RdoA (MazF antagonist)
MKNIDTLLDIYREKFNLHDARFERIEHEDAMVAPVYKITKNLHEQFILKVFENKKHYLRERFFLNYFYGQIPVPKILNVIDPQINIYGAILMEYKEGSVMKITDFNASIAKQAGAVLAEIHSNRTNSYGELIETTQSNFNPIEIVSVKFEEGLKECIGHLPDQLIEQTKNYFYSHLDLLNEVDGPCIVHYDFRPGNIIALNNKITGIIDWSSSRSSFAEEDFCSFEHVEWLIDARTKKEFLDGYASIRPVPNYSRVMPILRIMKAITSMGFIVKQNIFNKNRNRWYELNLNFLENLFTI